MVVNNPNNWHWVDKNCLSWSKDYFGNKLVGVEGSKGNKKVSITSVSSVEGDCEVSQRKGKVISLFDLKLVLQYKGTLDTSSSEDTSVTGSITVPELAYDTDADDIQFSIGVYNESNAKDEIKPVIRSEIIPQLRELLGNFGTELITTHSSDIQLESDKVNSVFTKANQEAQLSSKSPEPVKAEPKKAPVASTGSSASPSPASEQSSSSVPRYNTSTLHLEPTFTAPAEQLHITLLDPQRIGAWTRSPPLIEPSPAQEGSTLKLFGGSIVSKITKLVPNEQITQDWRLEDWKQGHFAKLDIKFKQGSGETKMVVKFDGIPVGEEDRVKGNFEDYYIRSIKITFGFGAVL